jgi:hypothetical protein
MGGWIAARLALYAPEKASDLDMRKLLRTGRNIYSE